MVSSSFLLKIGVYMGLAILAALVTWLTGLSGGLEKGFPIPWATFATACPLPGSHDESACRLFTSYNWPVFAVDVLFYSLIAYSPLIAYAGYQRWKLRDVQPH